MLALLAIGWYMTEQIFYFVLGNLYPTIIMKDKYIITYMCVVSWCNQTQNTLLINEVNAFSNRGYFYGHFENKVFKYQLHILHFITV